MKLVIGNKNYSSWSLRPWLALAAMDVPFEEELIPLDQPDTKQRYLQISPAGKVPILMDGDVRVWESLAILEYLAEKFPEKHLWPKDATARARARSLCCEMISGFRALRGYFPMNLRRTPRARPADGPAFAEAAYIAMMWRETRIRFGGDGPFLFGAFTAADAMYAPVATRFRTYQIEVDPIAEAYVEAIHNFPPFLRWKDAALMESWVLAHDEVD